MLKTGFNNWRIIAALIIIGFSALCLVLWRSKEDVGLLKGIHKPTKDSLLVVITANFEGYIEPCGCTSDPLGGVSRFAFVVKKLESELAFKPLVIDSGNLLFEEKERRKEDRCQDQAKIDVLLKTLQESGLRSTMMAPFDLAWGEDEAQKIYKAHNVAFAKRQAITKYIERSNSLNVATLYLPFDVVMSDEEMAKELDRLSKEAREIDGAEVVILVAQLSTPTVLNVTKGLSMMDIVVLANTENMAPKAPRRDDEGSPIYFEPGRQGQYFTFMLLQNIKDRNGPLILDNRAVLATEKTELLKLRILGLKAQINESSAARKPFLEERLKVTEKELFALSMEVLTPLEGPQVMFWSLPLNRKIPADETVAARISDYEKAIPSLTKACEEGMECPKAGPNDPTYVGANTCKGCHQEAFDVWKKAVFTISALDERGKAIKREVGHSKAFKTLTDIGKEHDRSCIGCHSIGFMEPGGFCKTSDVDFRKDVQCESCHGAGSLHAQTGDKKYITRRMDEEGCRGCHHVPHIQSYESFDYEDKVQKVLGKGHGEAFLKELIHKSRAD